MSDTWVLIDLLYLAHRARFATKHLTLEDVPTGVIYGIFEQLFSICNNPRILSNNVHLFIDSRHSFRVKQFSGYKAKRKQKRTQEEVEQITAMHKQLDALKSSIFQRIGIPFYEQKGLESDDLLAQAARQLSTQNEKCIIVTGDGDLFQCIDDNCTWYDPQREIMFTRKSFTFKKQIDPSEWWKVKSIGGCVSDNVPGISGVSEKGALDYLLGRIPKHYKKYTNIREAFKTGEIQKWKELVKLPHDKTKTVQLEDVVLDMTEFLEVCKEYDMDSFIDGPERKARRSFFLGHFEGVRRR